MKYISYQLFLEQPLRIVDLDASKEGEWDTLSYIPGSTIRGAILSQLSSLLQEDLERKRELLSEQVQFLNAYPVWNGQVYYPSVKGFYEGKLADGELENILCVDKPKEGFKRAGLGTFCHMDRDTVFYGNVAKKDVLGIHVEKKNIFRSLAIEAHQRFQGYILISDKADETQIESVLDKGSIWLGSGKTSGYGKCKVEKIGTEKPQNMEIEQENVKEIFMVLRSNTSMRNQSGEICGLNLEELANLLGVENVTVDKASTSLVKVSGINRTWGCRTPEITMYQAGSVFKLVMSEPVGKGKLRQVEELGIGVNRQEGCGRISFTDGYAKITQKKLVEQKLESLTGLDIDDEEQRKAMLKVTGKKLAVNKINQKMQSIVRKKDKDAEEFSREISKSQYGIILNRTKNLRYNPMEVKENIESYVAHEKEKLEKEKRQGLESNGKRKMLSMLEEKLIRQNIFERLDLKEYAVCGFSLEELFTEEEKIILNLKLLQQEITYMNRTERGEDA